MANTILGVFDDAIAARRAMDALRASPLQLEDVSIVSRATESGEPVSSAEDVSAGEGAAVGAVWGGLVGLASLLIPGIGPFVAFGALGAALTGAVTGAVVGGITAALVDFSGIPEEEARNYETMVREGRTLVAVKARAEDAQEVRRILASAGASSIRDNQTDMTSTAGSPVHIAMYDDKGQRVNMEREFGARPSSTTTRRGIYAMPDVIDRPADSARPAAGSTTTTEGRAGQVQPRGTESGVDTNIPDNTRDRPI